MMPSTNTSSSNSSNNSHSSRSSHSRKSHRSRPPHTSFSPSSTHNTKMEQVTSSLSSNAETARKAKESLYKTLQRPGTDPQEKHDIAMAIQLLESLSIGGGASEKHHNYHPNSHQSHPDDSFQHQQAPYQFHHTSILPQCQGANNGVPLAQAASSSSSWTSSSMSSSSSSLSAHRQSYQHPQQPYHHLPQHQQTRKHYDRYGAAREDDHYTSAASCAPSRMPASSSFSKSIQSAADFLKQQRNQKPDQQQLQDQSLPQQQQQQQQPSIPSWMTACTGGGPPSSTEELHDWIPEQIRSHAAAVHCGTTALSRQHPHPEEDNTVDPQRFLYNSTTSTTTRVRSFNGDGRGRRRATDHVHDDDSPDVHADTTKVTEEASVTPSTAVSWLPSPFSTTGSAFWNTPKHSTATTPRQRQSQHPPSVETDPQRIMFGNDHDYGDEDDIDVATPQARNTARSEDHHPPTKHNWPSSTRTTDTAHDTVAMFFGALLESPKTAHTAEDDIAGNTTTAVQTQNRPTASHKSTTTTTLVLDGQTKELTAQLIRNKPRRTTTKMRGARKHQSVERGSQPIDAQVLLQTTGSHYEI